MADASIEGISSVDQREPNFGLEGVYLMYSAEELHHNRLSDLEARQQDLNLKLAHLKTYLEKCHKHLKSDSKEPLDISAAKEATLKLWNEWRAFLKEKDLDEYKSLSTDLEKLDFSKLTLEHLEDQLIPELEKIRSHFEFKYQKIPNELRLHMELFTIMVEILKEFPKKFAESISHTNRNIARG